MPYRPRVSVRGLMVVVGVLSGLCAIGAMAFSAREAQARAICANQLKNISLGFLNYHSAYESFPPATVIRPSLPPEKRLSWCVVLYAFADQWIWILDWNEPWDSPVNRVTRGHGIEEPPKPQSHCGVFECPRSTLRDEYHMPGWTSYVGITGLGPDSTRLSKHHPLRRHLRIRPHHHAGRCFGWTFSNDDGRGNHEGSRPLDGRRCLNASMRRPENQALILAPIAPSADFTMVAQWC